MQKVRYRQQSVIFQQTLKLQSNCSGILRLIEEFFDPKMNE